VPIGAVWRKLLVEIAGQIILTANDTPKTKAIFDAFDQQRAAVTDTAAKGAAKSVSELTARHSRSQTALIFKLSCELTPRYIAHAFRTYCTCMFLCRSVSTAG